ncbi:hypothetical protein BJ742DRAFT_837723 [Cladochytrium replicatum]|nr:hypothetical protein BJ742DRAFT_837723 [Cladochytrium replicatum]
MGTDLDSTGGEAVQRPDTPRQRIPNHLGDLFSSRETTTTLPPGFSPLERILLTANGNVQRILSAYFNSTVKVQIIYNVLKDPGPGALERLPVCFKREVDIICREKVCCHATSTITISNAAYVSLVTEKGVGIGQLFRYLNMLPEFELLDLGRNEKGFWRRYVLCSEGISCEILEEFPHDLFDASLLAGVP